MGQARMRRVDEAVREVLSEVLTGELKDPRIGFVTVTDVQTSPDLRHARVYVSVLGDQQVRQDCIDGLRSAHGFLQRRVARQLRIKNTPQLEFFHDDTLDRVERLAELLAEPPAPHVPDPGPPADAPEGEG